MTSPLCKSFGGLWALKTPSPTHQRQPAGQRAAVGATAVDSLKHLSSFGAFVLRVARQVLVLQDLRRKGVFFSCSFKVEVVSFILHSSVYLFMTDV